MSLVKEKKLKFVRRGPHSMSIPSSGCKQNSTSAICAADGINLGNRDSILEYKSRAASSSEFLLNRSLPLDKKLAKLWPLDYWGHLGGHLGFENESWNSHVLGQDFGRKHTTKNNLMDAV